MYQPKHQKNVCEVHVIDFENTVTYFISLRIVFVTTLTEGILQQGDFDIDILYILILNKAVTVLYLYRFIENTY